MDFNITDGNDWKTKKLPFKYDFNDVIISCVHSADQKLKITENDDQSVLGGNNLNFKLSTSIALELNVNSDSREVLTNY